MLGSHLLILAAVCMISNSPLAAFPGNDDYWMDMEMCFSSDALVQSLVLRLFSLIFFVRACKRMLAKETHPQGSYQRTWIKPWSLESKSCASSQQSIYSRTAHQ
ncbi:hypothetical protein IWX49DRAFT_117895 [Phyllosticta citricarpa]